MTCGTCPVPYTPRWYQQQSNDYELGGYFFISITIHKCSNGMEKSKGSKQTFHKYLIFVSLKISSLFSWKNKFVEQFLIRHCIYLIGCFEQPRDCSCKRFPWSSFWNWKYLLENWNNIMGLREIYLLSPKDAILSRPLFISHQSHCFITVRDAE